MSALTGVVVGALLLLAGAFWPAPNQVSSSPAAVAAVADPAPAPRVTAASSTPRPGTAPVGLRIPALGVDVPVLPVGVDRDSGGMAIPEDVATVGWYRYGSGPGAAAGSAVLSGHVDDREQGYGAFHKLGDLAPGDPVTVDLADGGVVAYRVEAVSRFPKTDLPVGEVFARDGAPRLTLVTCGGQFDYGAHGYTENVVVVARPDVS